MSIRGKSVLVTGSTTGIGEASARAFAAQGARVLVTGRNEERGGAICAEIEADGGTAVFCQADLSDRA